ncbi:MAG: type II toxin-antitoxin system VapC family toxin [Gemmatimonadetes bacterium]|nr:type II toxin-antitoxin system VapC family toxin [Gemmatimonadota bacterium]MYA76229.1 type II toxin-antitoxin system VapC family toxin [Gemmatimonadota bacterium]MYG15756.1 type II toxin-antitoxin system VapC family toxin [Gemmatimonadota bacterium]MYH18431.1 type II toxin-antitoxin system VapC family toxin [Gemmatimonadota bacterium]MYK99606.1 type II toxin-antitoxin system VapC family toxin [Gemmatimonadota bacterium]
MNAPVSWLLDANVISEMMRPHPEPRVAAFLDGIADQGIGLASITVWEILNGIGLLDTGRRRDTLADRFQNLLDDLFEDRIFDWTLNDARECARIMEAKRRRGEALEYHLPDAFLAATAARRGLTIVTRNTSEFRNTGVEVVNPWTNG